MPGLFQHCLFGFHASLTDSRPLGVAVSGGSDSMGLLAGLASVAPPERLVALTVDHGLRPGSADEARWVKWRCRQLGIRHQTLRWDGDKPSSGVQAAARAARYRLLAGAAGRLGLCGLVTAHTRDDQNETLAMRRARSCGDDAPGLAGISPATLFEGRMWVMRPLLSIGRQNIRDFLASRGAPHWVEDPSNADVRFERVRVRNRLARKGAGAEATGSHEVMASQLRLSGQVAVVIEAGCHVDAEGRVWFREEGVADAETKAATLQALIDWCGGASRPLDRRGKATLAAFLAPGNSGDSRRTISLGRTLLSRRDGHVVLVRECRDIPTLVLDPGAEGVWDRRYWVRNLSRFSQLSVRGGGFVKVMPQFSRGAGDYRADFDLRDGVAGGFVCRPLLGRNSHILPVQRLPMAQALARLAGAVPFPACPWPEPVEMPEAVAGFRQ